MSTGKILIEKIQAKTEVQCPKKAEVDFLYYLPSVCFLGQICSWLWGLDQLCMVCQGSFYINGWDCRSKYFTAASRL